MDTTIRITAQFYENYAIGPNGPEGAPYWKAKGGHEFILKADSDLVMYAPNLKDILTEMVADQSNQYEKFVYIGHEVQFSEPSELSSEIFLTKVRNQFENA
jgi:hypothetical protein